MRCNNVNKNKSLVLVRTPFQAWLVEKVIAAENTACYDFLYFTQNNSAEDFFYYNRLAKNACSAKFVFVPKQKKDIFNHALFFLLSFTFVLRKKYIKTIVSSIDSYVFNSISWRKKAGELVTFDDGTANYNKKGLYFQDASSWSSQFYRIMFRAKKNVDTRLKINRHYTIQPAFENIVDSDRLRLISGWSSEKASEKKGTPKVFFIGAPFHEVLSSFQVDRLQSHAVKYSVDAYVKHPREYQILDLGAPILKKKGRIAEEAILDDAGDRPIILIGFLSSVMFNLASCAARRIVLVPRDSQRHASLIELARKSGCEIVPLDEPE